MKIRKTIKTEDKNARQIIDSYTGVFGIGRF